MEGNQKELERLKTINEYISSLSDDIDRLRDKGDFKNADILATIVVMHMNEKKVLEQRAKAYMSVCNHRYHQEWSEEKNKLIQICPLCGRER